MPIDTCSESEWVSTCCLLPQTRMKTKKKNNNDFQKHISRLGIVRKSGWSMEVLVCNFELHFYFFRFQNDRISTSDQLVMMNDVSFAKCAMCIAYVWCGDARTHRTCWRPPYNLSVPFLFIQNWKMKYEQQNTADEEDEDDDEEKTHQQQHLRHIFMLYYSF